MSKGNALVPSTTPLVAGFLAGVVSTSILLPVDVVKVRLQVTESAGPSARRVGFGRALRSIVRYEGIRGLWVGWTPAVMGSAISWGGYFYFYEGMKKNYTAFKLRRRNSMRREADPAEVLTPIDNFLLACSAGAVMVAITNPIWLVKTRMQLQMKKASEQLQTVRPYANVMDAFRTIVREEGPSALYRGVGPAFLLTSHGGVQFVVYEFLRKHFHYQRAKRDRSGHDTVWDRLEKSTGYLTMGATAKM